MAGEIAAANRLLGYRWFVEGEVAAGHRRGRDLGYPTANIALWPDCDLRHGIYAVTATTADGRTYDGVASFGTRPTFDDGGPLLEAHLFDFDGDLYGSTLSVAFVDWLRRERKFDGADALIAAMHGDAAAARAAIAAAPAPTARDAALAATPPQERAARL